MPTQVSEIAASMTEVQASVMEDLQDRDLTVAELDWDKVFSLLQDCGMDPDSANLPLLANPTELEHNYHHFCSPTEEQTDPILASLESYSQTLQHWEQPDPITALPPMNYAQMPAYWEQEGPIAAPDMQDPMMAVNPYYGLFVPNYWSKMGTQALAYIHDQHKPHQLPEAAFGCPPALPQLNSPKAPNGMSTRAARMLRRQKEAEEQQEEEHPYIKKPQNAFMIFMKHQRPEVVAQHGVTDNAEVNKIMGKLWRSMSAQEQAPYYEQARAERQQHGEQNPNWSWKENYGKKRRRDRSKAARNTGATAAATNTEESGEVSRVRLQGLMQGQLTTC